MSLELQRYIRDHNLELFQKQLQVEYEPEDFEYPCEYRLHIEYFVIPVVVQVCLEYNSFECFKYFYNTFHMFKTKIIQHMNSRVCEMSYNDAPKLIKQLAEHLPETFFLNVAAIVTKCITTDPSYSLTLQLYEKFLEQGMTAYEHSLFEDRLISCYFSGWYETYSPELDFRQRLEIIQKYPDHPWTMLNGNTILHRVAAIYEPYSKDFLLILKEKNLIR